MKDCIREGGNGDTERISNEQEWREIMIQFQKFVTVSKYEFSSHKLVMKFSDVDQRH